MSISATVTPGYTFTDETITHTKLNSAASPGVSISDGSITSAEIASELYKPLVFDIDYRSSIEWQMTPGRILQFSSMEAVTDQLTLVVSGLENGMFGVFRFVVSGSSWNGIILVPNGLVDGFTYYDPANDGAVTFSPTTDGTIHQLRFFCANNYVYWERNQDFQ